jgi:hypothetical protein
VPTRVSSRSSLVEPERRREPRHQADSRRAQVARRWPRPERRHQADSRLAEVARRCSNLLQRTKRWSRTRYVHANTKNLLQRTERRSCARFVRGNRSRLGSGLRLPTRPRRSALPAGTGRGSHPGCACRRALGARLCPPEQVAARIRAAPADAPSALGFAPQPLARSGNRQLPALSRAGRRRSRSRCCRRRRTPCSRTRPRSSSPGRRWPGRPGSGRSRRLLPARSR